MVSKINNIPKLPEGFVLEEEYKSQKYPPLPKGFILENENNKDVFDEKEIEFSSSLKEGGRHLLRSASRATESILGLPADVLKTAQLGAKGLEKGASKIREKIGLSPLESKEKPAGFPGSSELREISQKIFGEIVTPLSKKESFIDEVISDAAALAIPVKGRVPFIRSIGTSLVGNIGQEGAKQLGFGEKGQVAAKIGAFFLSGLAGKGNVKKYWKEQYKLAKESIPEGTQTSTRILDKNLRNFEQNVLQKGGPTPAKKKIKEFYEELKKKSLSGEMDVDELVQFKHDLNQNRASLYDKELSSTDRRVAKKYYDEIAQAIESQIEQYGKKDPSFLKHWESAQEAYSGFYQSKKVGNWIARHIPFGKLGKTSLLLLEGLFRPSTLPYTAGAYSAFKSGELLTRMFKNKTLRKYYANLMKDSINENKSGFLRNLKSMEKEMEENNPDIFDELAGD